jgi:FdhE protein
MSLPTAPASPPQFQPMHIGEEAKPPQAVTPKPETLFAERAMRFRQLAPDHPLRGYLEFMAHMADCQAKILPDLPAVTLPAPAELDRALEFGMAPISRSTLPDEAGAFATLDALLAALKHVAMPDRAMASLDGVIAADEAERRVMIRNVLDDALPAEEIAEHVFVAAAMQVHFARLAAALPEDRLTSVADGACPACGGPPVSSSVVGWQDAQSTRFVTCGCCATQWHVVRVKCVACSSTKGISYHHVEGTADTLKAECCDSCGSYLKILYRITDPALDAVADDVASAGLDLLVKEKGFRRSGFNVFLAGF